MAERIVAVVPAFQAARSVAAVVRRVQPFVERVLVVDDGSLDATASEAHGAGAQVLRHERNLGKGSALATAFRLLRGEPIDAVLTLDADGQHRPEEAPKLLLRNDPLDAAVVVLGVRHDSFEHMSLVRRTSNRLSSWCISRLAGIDAPDCQTGFRLYRRPVLDEALLPAGRFESETAVLIRATRRGYRVAYVPIDMDEPDGRASSHYRPLVDSARIARAMLSARFALDARVSPR